MRYPEPEFKAGKSYGKRPLGRVKPMRMNMPNTVVNELKPKHQRREIPKGSLSDYEKYASGINKPK